MHVYSLWRAGTSIRIVLPARQAGNRFLGSLKSLQNRALMSLNSKVGFQRNNKKYKNNPKFMRLKMCLLKDPAAIVCPIKGTQD